jgi:hypothetical protein
MAGIDVILGVIPLLIEVPEYSHTVYQQFKRWRKYASELEEFQEELFCYQQAQCSDLGVTSPTRRFTGPLLQGSGAVLRSRFPYNSPRSCSLKV